MKIVFICGSLEPAKDGVGDYTRKLSGELIKLGHIAEIIAINDKFITQSGEDLQSYDAESIPVLRLPFTYSWNERLTLAKKRIADSRPDWISLQFVIFTFDAKGLPFSLTDYLKPLNTVHAKWHIMFHELWVGMNKEASLKLKLWGYVQKQILRSFLNKIKPSLIHTHTHVYQDQLRSVGYKVRPLPLFTNFPIDNTLFEPSENDKKEEQKTKLVFSLFGGIYPEAPIEAFASDLASYASSKKTEPEVRFVGRTGKEQDVWTKALQEKNIQTRTTGELSAKDVSRELFTSHYGLSTTPMLLSGKSGAVATMLEHHLPVICISKPWHIKTEPGNISLYVSDYRPGNLSQILDSPYRKTQVPLLPIIIHQFVTDLNEEEENAS